MLDRILSNGVKTQYDYDAGGRLIHLKNTSAGGQIVNDTTYSRDRLGNILSQTEATGTGQTAGVTSFNYDPEYRLLSADYPGTANDEAFGYDKVGNRKTYTSGSLTANATTRYYQYNSGNRLLDQRTGSATGTVYESYQYDDNGSLTQIGGNRSLTLSWDANNRPSSIGTTSYQYDPAGYRIDKNGSQSRHYYLEGEHLEAAYDGSGNLHAQYFRGSIIDEVVNGYQRDSSNKLVNYSFHHDALQSVLGQSGHEGSILATQAYGAFGNPKNQTGTSSNQLKYTGREEDSESGCYYYRARIYCPNMGGRFISEDPKGFGAGVNFYAYVDNNPINANDPTGYAKYLAGIFRAGASALDGAAIALKKQINSADQLAQAMNGVGKAMYKGNEIKDINRLIAEYGGNAGDWAKMTSKSSYTAPDGQVLNTHWYNNNALGLNVEFKSIANEWSKQAGIKLFEGGSAILGGLAVAAEVLDPLTYMYSGGGVPPGAISTGFGYKYPGAASNGGFILYPNKQNTNMMQSIYAK